MSEHSPDQQREIEFITRVPEKPTDRKRQPLSPDYLRSRGLTLHKLEVFRTVATYGSVTRAAEHLNVAQPAVTAQIRSLEEALGTRLVKKSGRNIVLTAAGERVSFWAAEVMKRSSEMLSDIADIKRGVVGHTRLAASMVAGTYALPDIIVDFNRHYPDVNVSTSILSPALATQAVLAGDCDFGVTILDPNQNTSQLEIELLWKEPLYLIAAQGSTSLGDLATRMDLENIPYITPVKGQIVRELIDETLRAFGVVRTRSVLEFGHPEPILRAIREDRGAGFVFQSALPVDLEANGLRRVQTPDMEISMPLFLIHASDTRFSQPQIDLLDRIRQEFSSKQPLFQVQGGGR